MNSFSDTLLGGRSARIFLRRYWQKRPLLVRRALPDFRGVINERALTRLASRDDVESRIVVRRGKRWITAHGPFENEAISRRNATLLVSGTNLHLRAADELLRRFSFIPQARLDDLMVSFSTPGGGVGPHVDSYDVFLLQGPGRRRWTYWFAGNKQSVETQSGDLLYLPPGVKHDGVALENGFTYSIGFRAPRGAELGVAFLDWLHRRGLPDASYRDPSLAPARRGAAVPPAMLRFADKTLRRIRWSRSDVTRFLGEYLTEPKAHVVFKPAPASRNRRVRLDPKTQLLYAGARFFLNGEELPVAAAQRQALRELADRRSIETGKIAGAGLGRLIYRWQRLGYLS